MKVYLVISDTHGDIFTVRKILEQYPQIDGLIHLGDYYKDAEILKKTQLSGLDFIMVPGNCDIVFNVPSEKILEVEGKRILLTHGHNYDVKNGIGRLERKALKENINAVLFGHTHTPLQDLRSGIVFLNPGSISYPRGSSDSTYGLLEVSEKRIETRVLDA